jgi:hypothetical protein
MESKVIDQMIDDMRYKTIIEEKVRGYVEAVNLVDKTLLEVQNAQNKTFKIIIKECNCE